MIDILNVMLRDIAYTILYTLHYLMKGKSQIKPVKECVRIPGVHFVQAVEFRGIVAL